VPIERLEEVIADNKLEIFEIFREYMIDDLYLELAEETNDMRIYGKLQEACQAAVDQFTKTYNKNSI